MYDKSPKGLLVPEPVVIALASATLALSASMSAKYPKSDLAASCRFASGKQKGGLRRTLLRGSEGRISEPYNPVTVEAQHGRQKLFPICSVALRYHCCAATHPRRRRVPDSGQRDNLSSGLGKLNCLRRHRRSGVDGVRGIAPGCRLAPRRIARAGQSPDLSERHLVSDPAGSALIPL